MIPPKPPTLEPKHETKVVVMADYKRKKDIARFYEYVQRTTAHLTPKPTPDADQPTHA